MATPSTPPPTEWRRVAGGVVLLTAVMAAMLTAFALPPLHAGPNEIPIAVVGSAAATQQLRTQLEQARPGAFQLTRVADLRQARDRILDHDAYGAVVAGPSTTRVLIASAASPAVAQTLKGVAASLGQASGAPVPVQDVRPLPAEDPNGAGLAAGALPLVLGGWVAAVVLLTVVQGASRQVVGAFGFAVAGALGLTAILQFWFGSLDGNYLLTSAGVALGIAATAWTILGLRTALGDAGLGLGAVTLILLGNPLSGLASAPELLPAGWGSLGQLLPPGAAGTLLRSVAFFDGAGAGRAVLVLSCWLVAGIGLFLVGVLRDRRQALRPPQPAPTEPAADPAPVP
jgi:hypothetical protein